MTNKNAISRIRFMLDVGGSDGFTSADIEALNMAIASLTEKEQKTNGDRIRQMTDEELIELVNSSVCNYTDCLDNDCEECGRKWVMKEVSEDAGTD